MVQVPLQNGKMSNHLKAGDKEIKKKLQQSKSCFVLHIFSYTCRIKKPSMLKKTLKIIESNLVLSDLMPQTEWFWFSELRRGRAELLFSPIVNHRGIWRAVRRDSIKIQGVLLESASPNPFQSSWVCHFVIWGQHLDVERMSTHLWGGAVKQGKERESEHCLNREVGKQSKMNVENRRFCCQFVAVFVPVPNFHGFILFPFPFPFSFPFSIKEQLNLSQIFSLTKTKQGQFK